MVLLPSVCMRVRERDTEVCDTKINSPREDQGPAGSPPLPSCPHHSSKTPSNSLIEWEGDFYGVS